jgi:hypothetical protein
MPIAAPVRNPSEITRTIASLEGQPPSGLLVTPDYFVARLQGWLSKRRLPE